MSATLLFFLSHYGFIIGIGFLAYGIGRRLTQRIHYQHPLERISFCTTLGLGFLSYLILLVGTLGLLHRWFVLSVMGAIVLICTPVWRELLLRGLSFWRHEFPVKRNSFLIFLLGGLLLLPVFLMPLYPPTAFDSTMYHLAYAKIYGQAHQIVFTPYLRFPVSPQTNEMLFTLALVLFDDISAQLIQFLMLGVLSVGLLAFGRRHFTQKAGIWAVAILLSNPLVLWLGTNAYIDVGLTLFVTMASYSVFNGWQRKDRGWLTLGALFLGFAAGSKYSALFFIALFGLVLLYVGIRERKLFEPFLFFVTAIGVAFPWYFRNGYYTGNPVFPFFSQIFGYGLCSPQDLRGALDHLIHIHGTGKSIQSLILLPWNLTFNPSKFLAEAPISPIYLLSLPMVLLLFSIPKIRALFLIVLTYVLFWFSTAQQLRYLIPIAPLMSLAISASLDNALDRFSLGRFANMRGLTATMVICALLFAPGWLYSVYKVSKEGFPPFTIKHRKAYLEEKLPSYSAYQYLNRTKGSNYTVYALFDENMAYFADGRFMGDWFGPGRFDRIYQKLNNPRVLHQELRTLGADYLLVRVDKAKKDFGGIFLSPSLFKLNYKNDHVLLFEILN